MEKGRISEMCRFERGSRLELTPDGWIHEDWFQHMQVQTRPMEVHQGMMHQ